MKRSVHIPALVALIVASFFTAAALWWLWQTSLVAPSDIQCGHRGHSVFACVTNFGNYATVVLAAFALLIAWLFHKAFFTRFKHDR